MRRATASCVGPRSSSLAALGPSTSRLPRAPSLPRCKKRARLSGRSGGGGATHWARTACYRRCLRTQCWVRRHRRLPEGATHPSHAVVRPVGRLTAAQAAVRAAELRRRPARPSTAAAEGSTLPSAVSAVRTAPSPRARPQATVATLRSAARRLGQGQAPALATRWRGGGPSTNLGVDSLN